MTPFLAWVHWSAQQPLDEQSSILGLRCKPAGILQVVLQDQTEGHTSLAGRAHPGTAPVTNGGQHAEEPAAALRPYYDYLSFLFRRPPSASEHAMMEAAYRDHLQVCHACNSVYL